MSGRKRIAVLASAGSRDGPGSTLHVFLQRYAEYLTEYEIHATQGTYDSLMRMGLFDGLHLCPHQPGWAGGVVEIANQALGNAFEAIALLLDPTDPLAESPENVALQRVCISHHIPQLMNLGDLAHWIEYEAGRTLDNDYPSEIEEGGSEIVALVAHDKKKSDMMRFFAQYAEFLVRKHSELIATGTTGRLLVELCRGTQFDDLKKCMDAERWADLNNDRSISDHWADWLAALMPVRARWKLEEIPDSSRVLKGPNDRQVAFTLYESGPKGGDVQIAERVRQGTCNAIVFFHDPASPHPHDSDIRLCIRTCQLPKVSVTLRRDFLSARRWVNGCRQGKRIPLAGASVQQQQPGVWPQRCWTTTFLGNRTESTNDADVKRLAWACAGYLDDLLFELLGPHLRGRPRKRVLLLVSWGTTMRWIADHLACQLPIERNGVTIPLRRGSYGTSLKVAPMIGLTGEAGRWEMEAPPIAHDISRAYGGTVLSVASPAFFATRDGPEGVPPGIEYVRRQIEEHLDDADSYVIAVAAVRPYHHASHSSSRTPLFRYPELHVGEDARVETCGLFLDETGRGVSARFRDTNEPAHTLMTMETLSAIAAKGRGRSRERCRGEVIVICGYSNERRSALATMVRSGLVNTLVTDTETLRNLRADSEHWMRS